jgi:hypothetical protein
MTKKKSPYKTGSVTISVDYSYDVHEITFSGRTYDRVCSGKPIIINGQGFHWDGEPAQDYWAFNGGYGKNDPGRIGVSTEGGGDIYNGRLDDLEVGIMRDGQMLQSPPPCCGSNVCPFCADKTSTKGSVTIGSLLSVTTTTASIR